MEVGKFYISSFDGTIVECTGITDENLFKGKVVSVKNNNHYIGEYSESWAKPFFNEYYKSIMNDQIGGNHYKKLKIQPTEFIHVNNLSFIEGNIIKYIVRHKDKNGIEDLKKAKHYIDLLIKFEYEDPKKF